MHTYMMAQVCTMQLTTPHPSWPRYEADWEPGPWKPEDLNLPTLGGAAAPREPTRPPALSVHVALFRRDVVGILSPNVPSPSMGCSFCRRLRCVQLLRRGYSRAKASSFLLWLQPDMAAGKRCELSSPVVPCLCNLSSPILIALWMFEAKSLQVHPPSLLEQQNTKQKFHC